MTILLGTVWTGGPLHPQAEDKRHAESHLQERSLYTYPQALLLLLLSCRRLKGLIHEDQYRPE